MSLQLKKPTTGFTSRGGFYCYPLLPRHANFDVLALTVDTITGGNWECDLRPPRLTLESLLSFAMHPRWAADYFMYEKFELPQHDLANL